MSKFQFYIIDLFDGCVYGTVDPSEASAYAVSEDHFVIDSVTGEWLQPDGTRLGIEAAPSIPEDAA